MPFWPIIPKSAVYSEALKMKSGNAGKGVWGRVREECVSVGEEEGSVGECVRKWREEWESVGGKESTTPCN